MQSWLVRHHERIVAAVAASVWAAPLTALADVERGNVLPKEVNKRFGTLSQTITTLFNIVITVAGVAFVVLFLLGGIQYLAGAGNDETTKKARQLMLDAVIGLAIVVVAWAVGTYVLQLLGLSTAGKLNLTPTSVTP